MSRPGIEPRNFDLQDQCFTIKLSRYSGGGVGVKANCLKKVPLPIGGMPSVGVFLRDPSPYLRGFRRKPRKTPNG